MARNLTKKVFQSTKGISPVVATVILMAVTIVVALPTSYWVGSVASTNTRFEKLEFRTAYAEHDSVLTQWNVTLILKNSGSADTTITNLLINGKISTAYSTVSIMGTLPIIKTGQTGTIKFIIENDTPSAFTAGTTIEIRLYTASGHDYPKAIILD